MFLLLYNNNPLASLQGVGKILILKL